MRTSSIIMVAIMLGSVIWGFASIDVGEGALAFEDDILINQDMSSLPQSNPDIAVNGPDVYIVWQDSRGGSRDIYLRASHDGGLTFGSEVRVDDTSITTTLTDDDTDQVNPVISVSQDGIIYVVWADNRDGRSMIYISHSTDEGATFSTNEMVSSHLMGEQTDPHMDISPSGKIMIVWEDTRYAVGHEQIMGAYSTDGETFSEAYRISDTSLDYNCYTPRVAFSTDNDVHVVWTEDRLVQMDVVISSSSDGGVSFSSSFILNRDPSSSDQNQPDIDANSTMVAVVWRDSRAASADIYMTVSTDNALSFPIESILHPNSTSGHQIEPDVEIEGNGNISICWTSSPGMTDTKADIQMTRVYANGTQDEVETVNDPGTGITQEEPAMATGLGFAFIVWTDFRNNNQADIYFSRSIGSGQSGEAPVLSDLTVSPELGGVGTKFTFKVTYSDLENDEPLPGYPKLDLFYKSAGDELYRYPGSPFNMTHLVDSSYNMDYRDGETYIITIAPTRELELFHNFIAKAVSGNITTVSTEITPGPVLDFSGPEFGDILPEEVVWLKDNIIEFSMNITDDLSGVDPWSTFYQRYNLATMKWDAWQRKGSVVSIDNHTVRYTVNITLFDGDENKIRFRASDMVGNGEGSEGYTITETLNIWVDPAGPSIDIISPEKGSRLNDTEVHLKARIWDLGTGVDPGSLNVSYSLGGPYNYGQWIPVESFDGEIIPDEDEDGAYFLDMELSLTWGYNNFFKLRATDLLGNERITGGYQVAIIKDTQIIPDDRPPLPVSNIQPKVSGSVRPHITWTPTYDPEGDLVSYWLRITEKITGDAILTWTHLDPGVTYWDPDEERALSPSGEYLIEVVPEANGLNGTITNSTLIISPDANMPPGAIKGFGPEATSDPSPVLTWAPSTDPEGDQVIYFIRIGTFFNGGDIQEWTSTFTDTKFRIDRTLGAGMYHVQIMSSDATDFSPVSHFTMSIGIYSPRIESERTSVVIYPPEDEIKGQIEKKTEKVELRVINMGFTFDNIRLTLDGEATMRDDMDIYTQDDSLEISPGSSMNTTLSILIYEDTKVGLYSLNLTVTSLDGISSFTKAISIRIVDPDDIPMAPSDSGDEGTTDEEMVLYLIFAILFIIVLAMAYAYYRIDKRQREEQVDVIPTRSGRRNEIGPSKKKELGKKKKEKASLPPTSEEDLG